MIGNRVIFFLFDGVHLLDFAGAAQVFYEAGTYGVPYGLRFVSISTHPGSSAGISFASLEPPAAVTVTATDIVMVPGMDLQRWNREEDHLWMKWLQDAAAAGATVCTVCTGAFALAAAGMLDGKECTTHWKYTGRLQQEYPRLKVDESRLFVKSGNIYTSAGIATGIDLALYLMEERHGAAFACQLAKELVVYIRRDGNAPQHSIYLQNRQHVNYQVHQVQDYIIHHLHQKLPVTTLAEQVYMSPRNLTRLFKAATGLTIGQYTENLRREKARRLLQSSHKVAWVAKECGFNSPNQLRRILGRMPA
ncbi:MAG TPA: DJ-1/PfpI family protein [Chitinophaga sp.]|uniref:GlxA family transcriptional regulator n=1 Tax=Chitinophaga sp. TaxID=1869181 RepID=UPI002BBF1C5E|nr:DJ-1/PfpI family protein [Chitinophaga sp.]HVI46448.1 DJ-1/PfpI family protein [Chitinophaga sp.]